jgi:drug/metabolite transporter (DMT)-like permease
MGPLGVRTALLVGAAATWRVSHLIVHEDGPGQLVVKLRALVDRTPLAGVMDCFGCTSLWAGAATAAVLFGGRLPLRDVLVVGAALSGAALLAQRALEVVERPEYLPEPAEESPLVTVID